MFRLGFALSRAFKQLFTVRFEYTHRDCRKIFHRRRFTCSKHDLTNAAERIFIHLSSRMNESLLNENFSSRESFCFIKTLTLITFQLIHCLVTSKPATKL